jgi:antitoxin HicB
MTRREKIAARRCAYTVVFEPEPEGGYTVICPALRGLVTYGESLAEARRNALEAIEAYLESLQKAGDPIPPGEPVRRGTLREAITIKLPAV